VILENIENTIVPEMDYNAYKMVSYTQFSMWSECPHRWKLAYIDKHKSPPSINLAFGTAVHETLQEYLKLMYHVSIKSADEFNIHLDFQERLLKLYQEYKDQLNANFATKDELVEFINDGLEIIDYFIKYRQLHFSKHEIKLLGIESPILISPHEKYPDVKLYGKLDLVFYNVTEQKVIIWDIKTSTRGWSKYDKENKLKTSQMVLYKRYYSEQYQVPIDSIECKYFILKRKIPDDPLYPAMKSRIQIFEPTTGKTTINKVVKQLQEFIEDCFEGNIYKMKEYKKNPSDKTCKYCPFNDKPELCDKKS
jgi:hypothetical protein